MLYVCIESRRRFSFKMFEEEKTLVQTLSWEEKPSWEKKIPDVYVFYLQWLSSYLNSSRNFGTFPKQILMQFGDSLLRKYNRTDVFVWLR